jgi:hypothetical protein
MSVEMELVDCVKEMPGEVRGRRPQQPDSAPRDKPGRVALQRVVDWILQPTQSYADQTAAASDADMDHAEQWECVRRRLRRAPAKRRPTRRDLYQAYEEATGTPLGCD